MRRLIVNQRSARGASEATPNKQSRTSASTEGVVTTIEELVQLNAAAKRLSLPKSKIIRRPQTGSHHSRFKGRGMEFAEVRTYQAGDDVRSIDWRVTARKQTPHTKLYQEERERPVMIVCDQSASMFFGSSRCMKSVLSARSTALLSWSAIAHNDRVGGIVFSDNDIRSFKPARNRKSVLQLLKEVERFNQILLTSEHFVSKPHASRQGSHQGSYQGSYQDSPQASFHNPQNGGLASALQEACQVTKPGTMVFVISDFLSINEHSERHLRSLSAHNELILIHCTDPLERSLPNAAGLPVRDDDEVFFISSSDDATRNSIKEFASHVDRRLAATAKACLANLWRISTSLPIEQQLREVSLQLRQGRSS